MGWGEILLALIGFGFLAAGAAMFGEWLICGLDAIMARFGIAPLELREGEDDRQSEALDEGGPPFGSPAWLRRMRENEE